MRILVAIYSEFESWRIPDAQVAGLRETFPDHAFVQAANDEETLERIADAEVVFGARLRPEHVAAARRLRWVHSPAAGIGNMLFPAMVASPVVLTNSRGNSSAAIGEHVIAVALALLRDLPLAWRRQAERVWAQNEFNRSNAIRSLRGARVLIVGLGSIGGEVARLSAALGATVAALRRRPGLPRPDGVAIVAGPERLHEELPLADVIVLAAPQTAETRHLIGAPELALLKDGAVLVNVSRGKLLDEAALVTALGSGRLRAALDVFEHEPLAHDSPLWQLPHVLITPHVSGFHPSHWPEAVRLFADNLRRFMLGQPLVNQVDKQAGY